MKIKEFKYFYPEKPRLLNINQKLVETFSSHPSYVAERKYNENRLCLHCWDGKFEFWSRHGNPLRYVRSQVLLDVLGQLPLKGYCLFDGGLRHNKVPGIRNKIMFYDVVVFNEEFMIDRPFWYRRSILEKLFPVDGDPLGVPFQFEDNFREVFGRVIKDPEIEGIVIKNRAGILNLGRTSPRDSNWMWKARESNGRYLF